mmetsp:Transcript_21590/g.41190  ORF Transcript_21590/g.41190 Transcript_21590/m.41190 type:complete len:443 (-) Transcript_21590:63-1391(-)|eukprot:CAMPEP_0114277874 /NCGR_PEP_ID=MMETSP0059-20121206/1031_1 /TAXON_ID=36894 /ORGANISM="Pyramimonas parkeae, Strain CCMP726" /LENGTH=442 /DNA_ID=CAMNT_0001398025 /DNA_START=148 /DNA_END=1476 /DNA_ORIENTATION=-
MAYDMEYKIKSIRFRNRDTSLILQNQNGPCPLIALANVLLLRGVLSIHPDYAQINSETLLGMIGNEVMKKLEDCETEDVKYSVAEALNSLPGLQGGLNVNVRFNDVQGFEFLADSVVFDLLDIRLLHGWVVDPSDEETARILGRSSYNTIAERLVAAQAGTAEETNGQSDTPNTTNDEYAARQMYELEVIKTFLDSTAHQLTWHGLAELHHVVREDELAVLFRNNHFSTLARSRGQLYLLVTDTGYADKPTIVWEKLCEVGGDSDFVDAEFGVSSSMTEANVTNPATLSAEATHRLQEDNDLMMAMMLQEEEYNVHDQPSNEQTSRTAEHLAPPGIPDEVPFHQRPLESMREHHPAQPLPARCTQGLNYGESRQVNPMMADNGVSDRGEASGNRLGRPGPSGVQTGIDRPAGAVRGAWAGAGAPQGANDSEIKPTRACCLIA